MVALILSRLSSSFGSTELTLDLECCGYCQVFSAFCFFWDAENRSHHKTHPVFSFSETPCSHRTEQRTDRLRMR
jgi:hypothetical protein